MSVVINIDTGYDISDNNMDTLSNANFVQNLGYLETI